MDEAAGAPVEDPEPVEPAPVDEDTRAAPVEDEAAVDAAPADEEATAAPVEDDSTVPVDDDEEETTAAPVEDGLGSVQEPCQKRLFEDTWQCAFGCPDGLASIHL